MKRLILSVLVIALTFAAVMASMMPSAKAETIVFTAQMLAANEVAPVAVHPTEQGATGQAIVTLDTTVSGGVITAATARFDVTITGMASNTVIILAHSRRRRGCEWTGESRFRTEPGQSGSDSRWRSQFQPGQPPGNTAVAQAIINNPSGWYFNSHSALSPGGIARGQLIRLQQGQGGLPAPTLSEWGAIIMTLLFLAVGTFFLVGRTKTAEALAGGGSVLGGSMKAIDFKLLAKVALYVEVIIGLSLIVLSAGLVDVLGALTSGLVAAFIIHLFIGSTRRT